MSEFEHYLTNPSYARAYGFNNKGLIYVENERDCAFWEEIIEATNPDQYDIKRSITENDSSRGKRNLEKLYQGLNESVLVAIDADFDYLCPKKTESSAYVSGKYILHTFSYSRESVMCNITSINDTIKRIRLYEKANFDMAQIINAYSSICYKILPKFLFLLNERKDIANEAAFHDDLTIKITREIPLFLSPFNFNFSVFDSINEKVTLRLERYDDVIERENISDDLNNFMRNLELSGINEDNAYRYISGHLVYENLILPILNSIKKELMNCEIEKVREIHKENPSALRDNINGIKNHFHDKCSHVTLLENCEKIKEDDIYLMILEKSKRVRN